MPTYLSPGVYVEEVDSGSRPIEGVGTAVAAFVGLAEDGPFNTPTLVANWTQYVTNFGGFVEGSYLAQSVYAYFQNGGGNCYVVRIGQESSGNGGSSSRRAITAGPQAMLGTYRIVALDTGAPEGSISVDIHGVEGEGSDGLFKLVVRQGDQVLEEYDRLNTGRGKANVATAVNATSKVIPIEEITMICVPDLMSAYQQGAIDAETVKAVQLAMIAHCELMGDRIAILDPPPGLNAQQIKEWRVDKAGYDSKYAALYWPWIKAADPASGKNIFMPPSGFMAGIWGRNDDTRGVHKAPANEVVRGAISLEVQITKNEHDLLNPVGINCIRSFPGRGIRVWGARTLSSDPAWRYLNVRRLFNYLEESILNGTNWVVFEPNDDALWAKIRRTISAFLVNEWRKGALFGLTPDEAFYVKCDRETNPAEGIDAGQVLCQIGVAPVKPAEFVIFQLSQFSGGTSLVAE